MTDENLEGREGRERGGRGSGRRGRGGYDNTITRRNDSRSISRS